MSKPKDSFASRWSRRKQQLRRGGDESDETKDSEMPGSEPAAGSTVPLNTIVPDGSVGRMQTRNEANRQAEVAAREAADRGEANTVLSDVDMPPVESLDESSDYSGFMSPGVSEKLRKLALRKLFAGAGFNVRDGLDDYDDDFTNFEGLGDLITCDMKHRAEMEAAKKESEEEARLALEREEQEELAEVHEEESDDREETDSEQQALENKFTEPVANEVDDEDSPIDKS